MSDSFVSRLRINALFGVAKQKPKTHDYRQFVWGEDYIFESNDSGNGGYMTGQGKGIKRGDYLILSNGTDCYHYQVEQIDYYSNASDIWIALLKKVTTEAQI
jgi:MioC protein